LPVPRERPDCNEVRLSARVAAREALRYTPGGVPILGMTFEHQSRLTEASAPRVVDLTIEAVAIGNVALALDRVEQGRTLTVRGFLANRSRRSTRAVLHVNEFELER
jgi:primosomal replication protein N